MAAVDYPDTLPMPLLLRESVRHVSPLMRTRMVSGRARQRRRFSSVPSYRKIALRMRGSQVTRFELWFKHEIFDGAQWFNIRLNTPRGVQVLEARFADMYEGPDPIGFDLYEIKAEIELEQRPLAPPEWQYAPEFLGRPDIFDMAMNRHWADEDRAFL